MGELLLVTFILILIAAGVWIFWFDPSEVLNPPAPTEPLTPEELLMSIETDLNDVIDEAKALAADYAAAVKTASDAAVAAVQAKADADLQAVKDAATQAISELKAGATQALADANTASAAAAATVQATTDAANAGYEAQITELKASLDAVKAAMGA